MGVKNAILKIVDELNASDDEILVYGPLIHNPQTIDVLKQRGLVTINSLDEIARRQIAIRTHGIPVDENRKIREEASRTINLTCSRVARVQSIIKKYSKSGYHTIIIGDYDHAEVIGLKSYAASGVTVVSDKNDISDIPAGKKYIVVSQTTHERREFDKLVKVISRNFKDALIIDTICDSTRLRQDDVTEGINKGIDTLVVVGGKISANTTRLAKIGTDNGIKTIHIETEDELNPADFEESDYILVTAGASTPGWIINNVLEKLYAIKNSRSSFPLRILRQCCEFLVRSSIISSFSSFFMALIALKYANLFPDLRYGVIAFFYIFVMYSVNNYLDKNFLVKTNSYKYKIYKQYGRILLFVSIIFFIMSLIISYTIDPILLLLIGVPYFLGIIYSTPFCRNIIQKFSPAMIKKVYNTKIVTAFGWLVLLILIPYFDRDVPGFKILSISMFYFSFVFLRQILIDLVAFQGDLILGRETLPTWIGIKNASAAAYILSGISGGLFAASIIYYGMFNYFILLIPLICYIVLLKKIGKTDYLISLRYEFIIDANLIFFIITFLL